MKAAGKLQKESCFTGFHANLWLDAVNVQKRDLRTYQEVL